MADTYRTFEVHPGHIQGKGRPRFCRTGRAYTPQTTKDAELEVAAAYKSAYDLAMADYAGPVHLTVMVAAELPKSAPRRRIGEENTHKPDWDNVGKLVCDALNGIAWRDDSQVTFASIRKMPLKAHGEGNCIVVDIGYGDDDGDDGS